MTKAERSTWLRELRGMSDVALAAVKAALAAMLVDACTEEIGRKAQHAAWRGPSVWHVIEPRPSGDLPIARCDTRSAARAIAAEARSGGARTRIVRRQA